MEAIRRKRRLNEIDTNIPVNESSDSTLRDARKFIRRRLKKPKLITPSEGCENNVRFQERDGEQQTESPKLSQFIKTDESVSENILRCRMETCERSMRKTQINDSKSDETELDFTLDITPPENISSLNVPVISPSKIGDEISIQEDDLKEKATVEAADAKEIKLFFALDYIEEIIIYEFGRENQFKLSREYCKKYDIDPTRREILIDWLISVQVHFKARNPTLHLAVNLLDNLLDRIYIPCSELQVSAIAAFWVAYKFMEGNLSVQKLINICAGAHGKEIILNHEILVLKLSGFLQTGGSASTFFIYVMYKIFGGKFQPEPYYSGQFFIDIMMTSFVFISSSACERAVTAAYVAITIFNSEIGFRFNDFSRFITREKLKFLSYNLTRNLHIMYRDEGFMRNSNLFKKYKSSRYFKISVNKTLRAFAT